MGAGGSAAVRGAAAAAPTGTGSSTAQLRQRRAGAGTHPPAAAERDRSPPSRAEPRRGHGCRAALRAAGRASRTAASCGARWRRAARG